MSNLNISGTGKHAPNSAGMSLADFSSATGTMQNITVNLSTIYNNKNRGINVKGNNALVDVNACTLTNNGFDSNGSGNNGFGISAHDGGKAYVDNCYITNPLTSTFTASALVTFDRGLGGGTIIASNNHLLNNGNGWLANNSGGTLTATCNWWGSPIVADVQSKITGTVTSIPWLVDGTDDGGNPLDGFQPLPFKCYGSPIELNCVADQTEAACQTQAAIDSKFATWLASTTASGCDGTLSILPVGPVAPSACGGSITVTWTYTSDCGPLTCIRTFTVLPDLTAPDVTAPDAADIECSTGLPAAATTIAQFLALSGAAASDNCTAQGDLTVTSVTGTIVGTQCNGTITRTYTIRDLCNNSTSVNQVFTVTDNTIPVATAPPARSIEGCTELTALPQPKQIVVAQAQAPETYYVDRYAPYGFSVVNYLGSDILKHEINASDCETCRPGGYNSAFYNTQGRKYDTPDALSLAIDLYIPSDWATTNKRMAGLWGTAIDASNGVSAYPIVEFTSDGGVPRFRGWNSDPGGWIDMGLPTGFAYNNWYTITIKLTGDKFIYQVGDLTLTENALGSVSISNMILQGHNNLTGVTYDIYWDNFKTSGVKLAYSATPVSITESQYSAEGGSASDNCVGIGITYQDSKAGTCPIVVTRTFNITDVCGNPVTKTQTIQIDDTQPPALTGTAYSDATVYNACRANAQATVPAFNGANAIIGYTDNCGQAVTAEWTSNYHLQAMIVIGW